MTDFRLRFPVKDIPLWISRYSVPEEEKNIKNKLVPKVAKMGYLDKKSFLAVCEWKTHRTKSRCANNSQEFIQEVTSLCLGNSGEELRISALTLLRGVSWPTASVILHWFHKEPYPILDIRALWSLSTVVPKVYDFDFWLAYTHYCRDLAQLSKVSMRELDCALWQYSKENE